MCCRSVWRALVTDGGSNGFENISCKLQEVHDMTASTLMHCVSAGFRAGTIRLTCLHDSTVEG